jgi:DHA1 family multidrug resistance protein-like MFS transporter
MSALLRESTFGRLMNYLTDNRAFPYLNEQLYKIDRQPSPSAFQVEAKNESPQRIVDWNGADDPEMPRNWPIWVKAIVMTDVMLLNFTFYVASAIFTPSIPYIEDSFGATTAEGTLGLSLFVIAYGIGPLIVSFICSSYKDSRLIKPRGSSLRSQTFPP